MITTLKHGLKVASNFPVHTEAFWLGLCHDLVEDCYWPKTILPYWPALDAITRREGEVYADYIKRVAQHPVAKKVKLSDLYVNIARCKSEEYTSLRLRYKKAIDYLIIGEFADLEEVKRSAEIRRKTEFSPR